MGQIGRHGNKSTAPSDLPPGRRPFSFQCNSQVAYQVHQSLKSAQESAETFVLPHVSENRENGTQISSRSCECNVPGARDEHEDKILTYQANQVATTSQSSLGAEAQAFEMHQAERGQLSAVECAQARARSPGHLAFAWCATKWRKGSSCASHSCLISQRADFSGTRKWPRARTGGRNVPDVSNYGPIRKPPSLAWAPIRWPLLDGNKSRRARKNKSHRFLSPCPPLISYLSGRDKLAPCPLQSITQM